MQIIVHSESFSVCKLATLPDSTVLPRFIACTESEISLVCRAADAPKDALRREDGWRLMQIAGTLDFALIGIIAKISAILAKEGISIFVISTYDTDYFLVRSADFERAQMFLRAQGYEV